MFSAVLVMNKNSTFSVEITIVTPTNDDNRGNISAVGSFATDILYPPGAAISMQCLQSPAKK